MKKKLAFIIPCAYIGGAEIVLNEIFSLIKNEFDIYLITINEKNYEFFKKNIKQIKIIKLEYFYYLRPLGFFKTIFEIRNFLKKEQIKIIIGNQIDCINYLYFLKLFFNYKCFLFIRNEIEKLNFIKRIMLKKMDKILAIAEHIKKALGENNISDNVILVKDCMLKRAENSKDIREKLKIPENVKICATVGNLVKFKNQKLIIEIAKKYIEKYKDKDILFLIIGSSVNNDYEYKNYLKEEIERQKIGNYIKIIESIKNINEYMSNFNCMIHTSKYEAYPRVILEAFFWKVPVIAYKSKGAEEIIEHKKTGFLFKDNLEEAVDNLRKVLTEKNIKDNIIGNAYKELNKLTNNNYEEIFKKILK